MWLSMLIPAFAGTVLSDEVSVMEAAFATIEAETCAPVLNGVYERLKAIDPDSVDRADLEAHGEALVEGVFSARLQLEQALVDLHAAGPVSEDCITGARRVDLATRYLVDHLYLSTGASDPWLRTPGFEGVGSLRSGDVLVTRGATLSSAGIAHIGRVDSQFSHNAMVYVDPAGKSWTVEAYLEKGALVQPLEDFLAHELGRIVVMRYQDGERAGRAAKVGYERIANGEPIEYDEQFDHTKGDQLFCSEIAPWTFPQVGGPTDIPLHKTVFPQAENGPMFEAMGVTGAVITAPVDLIFDPRFRMVAEWRSVEELQSMRRHDAVVEALFRWMEEEDYRIDEKWRQRAVVDIGLALRRTPLIGAFLKDKVHPNGDRQFLVAGLGMQEAGEALNAEFDHALEGVESPSYARMQQTLEDIRVADLAVWTKKPRKSTVHKVVHP